MLYNALKGGEGVKVRIEESENDEIVIRCKKQDGDVFRLAYEIQNLLSHGELLLTIGNKEYYVSPQNILFFETDGGKIFAHTDENMYETQLKLYDLEGRLPQYFVRISKSCIANIMKIDSISRNITGASEISFVKTNKIVYCSRSYLKMLTDKIKEMRL